jgi:hypothetical protein
LHLCRALGRKLDRRINPIINSMAIPFAFTFLKELVSPFLIGVDIPLAMAIPMPSNFSR